MTEKWKHSGTKVNSPSDLELAHARFARRAASEGIVLLKNEGLLPLDASSALALLGSGANKTVKGGIGSGDVNNRRNISIYEGIREAGTIVTSSDWLADYDRRYQTARERWKEKILKDAEHVDNPFDAYAANPFVLPEGRELSEKDVTGASAVIYVVSRISGEGKDRRLEDGDYYLSRKELRDLMFLKGLALPVILLINSGGPVEITDILEKAENIKAVLNISQLGQEGGRAVADVIFGAAVPSGKLTATWAKQYEDLPCAEDYSYLNNHLEKEEYREGIYVGYRYFDSFGIEPLFPFGYGLSYTSFRISFNEIETAERTVRVKLDVENTGSDHAGKEVVQVYARLPYGTETGEYKRLAGFAKTDVLQPGERQEVIVDIDQKQLAVFSEERQAWIVMEGNYELWAGNSSEDIQLMAFLNVSEEAVLEKTHKICPKQAEFTDMLPPEKSSIPVDKDKAQPAGEEIPVYPFVPIPEEKRTVCCVTADSCYTTEELIPLLYGNITIGASTLGSSGIRVPGSAGETSECLEKQYGIRSLIMADGPAGLRLRQSYQVDHASDTVYSTGVLGSLENGFLVPMEEHDHADTYYQFCTAFPVGTALAQTWDTALLEEFGQAVAEEMCEYHVDLWLAPGMNIQRNPLCGRNFEYFSEDPLLSGKIGAAITKGVQSVPGRAVTVKHFACNSQEDNRMGVDSCVSEKALREIYLRGFEIAVKEGKPETLMTSYNLINGVHAANSTDLCTTLARKEWGFDGVIMSDWNTTVPADGSIPWKCADAGNDIIMPGNQRDDEDIRQAWADGRLSEEKIRACAGRVIALIKKLSKEENG